MIKIWSYTTKHSNSRVWLDIWKYIVNIQVHILNFYPIRIRMGDFHFYLHFLDISWFSLPPEFFFFWYFLLHYHQFPIITRTTLADCTDSSSVASGLANWSTWTTGPTYFCDFSWMCGWKISFCSYQDEFHNAAVALAPSSLPCIPFCIEICRSVDKSMSCMKLLTRSVLSNSFYKEMLLFLMYLKDLS